MKNQISVEQLEKYFNLTSKALAIAKENIISGKNDYAKEIIEMVENLNESDLVQQMF